MDSIMRKLGTLHLVCVKTELLTELVDFINIEVGEEESIIMTTDEMMVVIFNQHQDMLVRANELDVTIRIV